jgi:hypothetical protein
MIENDAQLKMAQEAVRHLQSVLLAARGARTPSEYHAMSAPLLLELQRRDLEILQYLSRAEAEASVG